MGNSDGKTLLLIMLPQLLGLTLIERWLPNEPNRIALTTEYVQAHHPSPSEEHLLGLMKPNVVVLHWTGSATARSTWNTFSSATLRGRKALQGAGALNVSAHFLVDRDGSVQQLLPENRIARHCIGLNHLSIGIENVGTDSAPLTSAQLTANLELIEALNKRHTLTHVIGHFEYRAFEGHPYFAEKDSGYRTVKRDPGAEFLVSIRAGLSARGLTLQGPPEKL